MFAAHQGFEVTATLIYLDTHSVLRSSITLMKPPTNRQQDAPGLSLLEPFLTDLLLFFIHHLSITLPLCVDQYVRPFIHLFSICPLFTSVPAFLSVSIVDNVKEAATV